MAEQTVTYLIGKDGKITVEVNGVRGPACRELVKETVEKLGVELSVELKPKRQERGKAAWRLRCGSVPWNRSGWLPFCPCRCR